MMLDLSSLNPFYFKLRMILYINTDSADSPDDTSKSFLYVGHLIGNVDY